MTFEIDSLGKILAKNLYSSTLLRLGLFGGLAVFLLAPAFCFGQAAGITISPVKFELTANPGESKTNSIKVANSSNASISVVMEVEDFTAVGETGQVALQEGNETYSLVKWIKVSPQNFTLGPKEQKIVDFTIDVPLSGEPGGHYGSVLAVIGGSAGSSSGSVVSQKIGALALLTVAGDFKEYIKVKEFSAPESMQYGPVPFVLRFDNIGTVHVKPKGLISITNLFGKKVGEIEFDQKNVLPGAVRKINEEWKPNKMLFGRYTATLVGSYGISNKNFEPAVITFWVIPWKWVALVGGGILVVLIILFLMRKRIKTALKVLVKGEA